MKYYLKRPYFSDGDDLPPEIEEEETSFFNDSLLTSDEQKSIRDYRQVMTEKMMQHAVQTMEHLLGSYEEVFDGMDAVVRRRANAMLVQFQQAMYGQGREGDVSYSVDCYTDESIIIRFSQRKDVRLTMNFTEPEYVDEQRCIRNIEEAYLSYLKGEKRVIRNSTLDNIIKELEKLI